MWRFWWESGVRRGGALGGFFWGKGRDECTSFGQMETVRAFEPVQRWQFRQLLRGLCWTFCLFDEPGFWWAYWQYTSSAASPFAVYLMLPQRQPPVCFALLISGFGELASRYGGYGLDHFCLPHAPLLLTHTFVTDWCLFY